MATTRPLGQKLDSPTRAEERLINSNGYCMRVA
eukprot:CAMPEP_0177547490 /NCGR_PEP_ID=MMETSP0369-20130122/63871_1 /TAXON_ID=447022 ORGANISM="Scrippsiella hangoei-like, Strain SHHI-4" /NCGR_SAMPLE_ID=MMETSP0369 /ASSEMBLY_ACC=CAM_ASM_000364 /LENGTH=32 /DNA_ID= /DNA_START= /DNA_END= /DNA_ORIENTATION=